MRIARGGLAWIVGVGLVTVACVAASMVLQGLLRFGFLILTFLGIIGLVLLVVFFRDPERTIGSGIVAVADGIITGISPVDDPDVGSCIWVKTFLNIHNVHVNRSPVDGTVVRLEHTNGSHLPAFSKDSDRNERVTLLFDSSVGRVKVMQIAGTVARRIIPYIKEGDRVKKGDRIGLIRLGSRVVVYLPMAAVSTLAVKLRDKVKAGEDTLADIHA